MNITLSIFVDKYEDRYSAGAYCVAPETGEHRFFGEIAGNEESVLIAILEHVDSVFEELGRIQFITTTTEQFNFLCRGDSRKTAPSAAAVKAVLRKISSVKGTKYKKNESPTEADVIGLARADMMNTHICRANRLYGKETIYYTDRASLAGLKKSHKKIPDIFLGSKIFHWGETESVEIKGDPFRLYYNGGFTPKSDTKKKDNTLSDFEKALRAKLYTYYTGSNMKLTDAGQRSLEEIRCITLTKEPHAVVERFFELQDKGIAHLPVTPVYVGNLDKIVGGASSQRLMSGEDEWFDYNSDSGDLIFNGITRTDISYVFYPQRLGPRIRNQFLTLRDKFIRHLEGDLIGEEIDITDHLYGYSVDGKGRTICTPNAVLNGKFNFVKMPVQVLNDRVVNVKYTFDIDCPPAKRMWALAKLNPKVSLVFENLSDTTIGYYTIVRTDIGISIYSCPEGSRLIRRKK